MTAHNLKRMIPMICLAAAVSVASCAQARADDSLVLIHGGTFTMGSPPTESRRGDDEVQHRVTVGDFFMARYEVTQEEYQRLVGTNPSAFTDATLPVENVSWFDAVEYCNARSRAEGLSPVYTVAGTEVTWNRKANGYRLPTEAEWEYACRAGTTTPFYTPKYVSAEEANYYGTYPYTVEEHYFNQSELETPPGPYRQRTVPVGSFDPNPWGLYDMHGNVREWCWDRYGPYGTQAQWDPVGPTTGMFRMTRGGGWNDFAKHLRSAYRSPAMPSGTTDNIGFRLVRNR